MKNDISLNESQVKSIKDIDEETFEEILMEINLKKPAPAYNYYLREFKDNFKSSLDINRLVKEISSNWAKMSEAEKQKYKDIQAEDRKRYKLHLALVKKYILEKPLEEDTSSYKIFVDEYVREAIENDRNPKEAKKEARDKWKALSSKDKKIYDLKKQQHKELYDSMKRMNKRITAYNLFVKDQMMIAKERGEKITLTETTIRWSRLKPSIKEKYVLYSDELREEKERVRDLFEITFGIKPRRPAGAYAFFLMEQAKEGKLEEKNTIKEGAKKWKLLTEGEKERYKKLSRRRQLSYIVRRDEYKLSQKNYVRASAWGIFASTMKGKLKGDIPGVKNFEVLFEKWRALDPEEKKKYFEMSKAKKEKIEKKLEDEKLEEKLKPKLPLNPYNRFISENFHTLYKNIASNEVIKLLNKNWKELSEHEKQKYIVPYEKEMLEYRKQLSEYKNRASIKNAEEDALNTTGNFKKRNKMRAIAESKADNQEDENENYTSNSKKPKLDK